MGLGSYPHLVKPTPADRPVLWHLAMSHYNEKARWALDFKRVPHVRRATMPAASALVGMRFGRSDTLPVMTAGGEVFTDSAEIIAALERMAPEPALYPGDPAEREIALALEQRFDLGIGKTVRQVGYRSVLADPRMAVEMLSLGGPPSRKRIVSLIFPVIAPAMRKRFDVPPPGDDQPLAQLEAEIDFIAAQVGESGYLVGERFSVADLTAAALLAPVVCPEAMPEGMPPFPADFQDLSRELSARPGAAWAREIYLRHRMGSTASGTHG